MGMIYRRKYKRPDGTTAEAAVWWIKYYRDGVPIRESTETDKETVARKLLREREGDVARGVPITARTNRATVAELLADVVTDYEVQQRRSVSDVVRRIALHLTPVFGTRRAATLTITDVQAYILARRGEGAATATINRELAALKRAFTLGRKSGKVTQGPEIELSAEHNARTGFFDRPQLEAVRSHLAPHNQAVATFAYITGWRIRSEVLPMHWRQVDFAAGTVRLDPGTTKNGDGRVFRMTTELRAVLEAQRAMTEAVQKEQGRIIPWVFHRKGEQIKAFRRNWTTACTQAGCPGMIPHDLRRSAVRNMVRAGIPERVSMQMTGHKTRAVFERYNIVSEGDLVDAAHRLDLASGTVSGTVGQPKRGARS